MAMEFGVFEGITLRHIARAIAPERRVTGFDTFDGLPDDWGDLLAKGTFATAMPSFEGLSNVALEVGRIDAAEVSIAASADDFAGSQRLPVLRNGHS